MRIYLLTDEGDGRTRRIEYLEALEACGLDPPEHKDPHLWHIALLTAPFGTALTLGNKEKIIIWSNSIPELRSHRMIG